MCMVRCLHPNTIACVSRSHNHQVCHVHSASGNATEVIHPAEEGLANKLLKYIDNNSPLPLNALGNPNHC